MGMPQSEIESKLDRIIELLEKLTEVEKTPAVVWTGTTLQEKSEGPTVPTGIPGYYHKCPTT